MTAEGFTVFWLLKREGVKQDQAEQVAGDMMAAFDRSPHWHTAEAQSREVRIALYKLLVKAGVANVSEIAEHIMTVVGRSRAE